MAEVSTTTNNSPWIDLDSYKLEEYAADLEAKRQEKQAALFEETREWCEEWYCPTAAPGWRKALDSLLNLALTMVYELMNALISMLVAVVGPAAKLIDEVLVVLCYLVQALFGGKYCKCCGPSEFLDALRDFIQSICDKAINVYKKMLKLIYKVAELLDRYNYSCECDRIKEDTYKEQLDAARAKYGDQNEYVLVVGTADSVEKVCPTVDSDTGEIDDSACPGKQVYKVVVKKKIPAVTKRFKKHVEYTVMAYNKWPYGADMTCKIRAASWAIGFVVWKQYVQLLVNMWLSTSNVKDEVGYYTVEQHEQQMQYCKDNMPKELYNYVLSRVGDIDEKGPCDEEE